MHRPKSLDVSVVIPVYNHAVYLDRALAAIAAQTRPAAEVIVVDDASTDGSAEVAADFAARLAPSTALRLVRNSENMGVNASANAGLNLVRSPFVVCTAADDWLRPDFIAKLSRAAAAIPGVHLVTSAYAEHFEAENRTVEHGSGQESGVWYADVETFFDPDAVRRLWSRGAVTIPISASLVRTETLRDLGGFDPALKWHSDWFVATAIASRHGFAVVPEHLAVFRIAAQSYSGGNVRDHRKQQEVCRAICDKLGSEPFIDVSETLRRYPSPFAPFIRHMLPWTMGHPAQWRLFASLSRWWLGQAVRGRRPGGVRAMAERMGFDTAPH